MAKLSCLDGKTLDALLLKCLHFRILFGYRDTISNLHRIYCEEIDLQDVGNTTQKIYVDVVFLEYLIDVGTGAAEPAGEPRDCPALFLKRLLYQLSYVYHLYEKAWESYFCSF